MQCFYYCEQSHKRHAIPQKLESWHYVILFIVYVLAQTKCVSVYLFVLYNACTRSINMYI